MKLISEYNSSYVSLYLFNYYHFDNDDNNRLFISYLNKNNIYNFEIISIASIYSTNSTDKMIDVFNGSTNMIIMLENYVIDGFIKECNRCEKLKKIMNINS